MTKLKESERMSALIELVNDLDMTVNAKDILKHKTNQEIADLLRDHVWGEEGVFSPQAALIEEAIERLSNTKGEKR